MVNSFSNQGVRGESNPPPRPSQGRMQNRYTTDTISSPGWNRTSDLSHVTGMSCPLNDGTVSTPTRIRTRNASLEARNDFHFTIEACDSGRQGIRTLISRRENRLSRAARPTVSGYLPYCQWTHRESNPDFQPAELVSSRWTMSPFSQWSGNRTQAPAPAVDPFYPLNGPRGIEPHFLLTGPASSC